MKPPCEACSGFPRSHTCGRTDDPLLPPRAGIKIVDAPRPEEDTPETWRALIRSSLPEHERGDFDRDDFVPCFTCSSAPGCPSLCRGCLANRNTIGRLRGLLGK